MALENDNSKNAGIAQEIFKMLTRYVTINYFVIANAQKVFGICFC
jgi:hypothetical protein